MFPITNLANYQIVIMDIAIKTKHYDLTKSQSMLVILKHFCRIHTAFL